jgi:lysyl-tRNA synthetase class 2
MIKELIILSKALRPLPEKWHGLQDKEAIYRQRYLDILSNHESFKRFQFRSRFVQELRKFYWSEGFTEIETPILQNTASGALAKPFTTHHNAYATDVYLRIAPEIHLKEAIIGGFDRVFEIGRVFRNEGTDSSHLQDFTMVEHYVACWDYKMNMEFMEKMLRYIIEKTCGGTVVGIPDANGNITEIDFGKEWPQSTMRDLIKKYANIDISAHQTADDLQQEIDSKKIKLENAEGLGRGNLIDMLYKKTVRPHIINPLWLIDHPADVSPLARPKDDEPMNTERFQLVVNGWEIVNGYSELTDPNIQESRFAEQAKAKAGGDDEAMAKDDEFVEALEHGMPPTSGMGMGVDRLVALLTQQSNLRDVVLFPLMRPKD